MGFRETPISIVARRGRMHSSNQTSEYETAVLHHNETLRKLLLPSPPLPTLPAAVAALSPFPVAVARTDRLVGAKMPSRIPRDYFSVAAVGPDPRRRRRVLHRADRDGRRGGRERSAPSSALPPLGLRRASQHARQERRRRSAPLFFALLFLGSFRSFRDRFISRPRSFSCQSAAVGFQGFRSLCLAWNSRCWVCGSPASRWRPSPALPLTPTLLVGDTEPL